MPTGVITTRRTVGAVIAPPVQSVMKLLPFCHQYAQYGPVPRLEVVPSIPT